MPRAAQGLADHQPLGERPRIVGAGRAHGEDVVTAPRQHHRLAAGVTQQQSSVGELAQRDALAQIRSLELSLRSAHGGDLSTL